MNRISAKRLAKLGGKLPSSTILPKKPERRFPGLASPDFLAWIRQRPCAMAPLMRVFGENVWHQHRCFGRVEAAHIKSKGAGGADEGNTLPLCASAHSRQHTIGIKSWAAEYGLSLKDLKVMARRYLELYEAEQGAPKL